MVLGEKPSKPSKKGKAGLSAEDIAMILAAIFNTVGSFRGAHWYKSPDDCRGVAETLYSYLQNSDHATNVKFAKAVLPLQGIITVLALIAPILAVEKSIYETRRASRSRQPNQRTPGPSNPSGFNPPQTPNASSGEGYEGIGSGGATGDGGEPLFNDSML